MQTAIRCTALTKRYNTRPPVEAVRGIDLEIAVGECFGLLGPNGAGKTTTMEILEGLLKATSGEVEILGLRWGRDDAEIRRRIGISLQETRLADKLTVLETVTLFRSFYPSGMTPMEAIEKVSLQEKAKSYVVRLSGGQRQRLSVACALAGDPELLFLDEPTTGLDPQSRRQLWEIIEGFKAAGRTVFLTTHYMDEAEKLCDRVAVVDRGLVIALGTPAALIASIGGEHLIDFSLLQKSHDLSDDRLRRVETVETVSREADRISLAVRQPHLALPSLVGLLASDGYALADLTIRHATLEDVFVRLTGRNLRDTPETSA